MNHADSWPVCRGSYALGSACGQCKRCADELAALTRVLDDPEKWMTSGTENAFKIPQNLQPQELGNWEFHCVDGVFVKQMHLPTANIVVPQHLHRYDHNTLLAAGKLRVWKRDEWIGDYFAPTCLFIEAHTPHTFMSLADNTVAYCIHNVSRSGGAVDIVGEHQLAGL